MKYTDAEIDAVALAILNSDRANYPWPLPAAHSLDECSDPDRYRRQARAALAARDALFEVARELWVIDFDDGSRLAYGYDTQAKARAQASQFVEPCHVVRITTKRRKR